MPLAIWWIRRDLRLCDNPALRAALDATRLFYWSLSQTRCCGKNPRHGGRFFCWPVCACWMKTCADAALYFRVFNPVLQGKKFDPHGTFVRRWLPELARLPDQFIH